MKSIVLLLMIIVSFPAVAQDPLFSQFFYSPQYLNPGLTGSGKNEFRANFNSRLQWVNLQAPAQAYTASADYYFSEPKMSLGLLANRFNEGYLKTSQAYVLFAKNFANAGLKEKNRRSGPKRFMTPKKKHVCWW